MSEELILRKSPGLRTRPVPEVDSLMVFSPHSGKIHWLGLNTWLLFELCDGRSLRELERGYSELAGDKLGEGGAQRQVQRGLDSLIGSRLVEALAVDTA